MYILFLIAFMYYYRMDYLFLVNNLYVYLKSCIEEDYTVRSIEEIGSGIYKYSYNNGKQFYYIGEKPFIYSKEQVLESIYKSSHRLVKTEQDIILGELAITIGSRDEKIDALEFVQMCCGPLGNFYRDIEVGYIENKLTKHNLEQLVKDYMKDSLVRHIVSLSAMDSEGIEYEIK